MVEEGTRDAPPPPAHAGPNAFSFMQFLRKFGKIVCWVPPPPWGVGAPSSGKSWIRHSKFKLKTMIK